MEGGQEEVPQGHGGEATQGQGADPDPDHGIDITGRVQGQGDAAGPDLGDAITHITGKERIFISSCVYFSYGLNEMF